jgi:predicted phage baseplate assembly protein
VRQNLMAGAGPDQPPRVDDPDEAARIVAWLRLRPSLPMQKLSITWAGVNAVEVEQLQTVTGRIVGQSDGTADQEMQLPATSVEPSTLVLQVEEPNTGFVAWTQVEDLATTGRDDRVYMLDSEAGTVRFGDGMRGKIPENLQRIRVAVMRSGGGKAGNRPPGSLTAINGVDASNNTVDAGVLQVLQTMETQGGDDSETLAQAEQRIPSVFRNRDRAVTEEDYKRLAGATPGTNIGRVEVMPRFKPQQRKFDVPGVVSVMVFPQKSPVGPPNPRADRPVLESVHQYLSQRVPVATELYVIGCEYVPISVSVAVSILDGFGQETVLAAVRDAVRVFLWPLAGGGTDGLGWKLGRTVRDREIDVIVARVPGVDTVNGINLFSQVNGLWQIVPRVDNNPVEIPLFFQWRLPELTLVKAVADTVAPSDLGPAGQGGTGGAGGAAGGGAAGVDFAIPVVPEVC